MNLHQKYAVKVNGSNWITWSEEHGFGLTADEAKAETRHSHRGAVALWDAYLKERWNRTMGDKPPIEIIRVERRQQIHCPW